MADTNVPQPTFTSTGVVLPVEADILAGTQADLNSAFGGNLNPALETPQGQLGSSLTANMAAANDLFALFVNQIDPDYSDGLMQEAIGKLYKQTRLSGTYTTVNVLCVGAAGTVIALGRRAKDTSGNIYQCTQAGTIPSGGSITLQFQNTVIGATPCPAGTLTVIYESVPGWDTVNNVADGTLGSLVEDRYAFEYRRQGALAANGSNVESAIRGYLLNNVTGVTDAYVISNRTSASVNYGSSSYAVAARSFYIAVVGGTSADIAAAIWLKANPGPGFVGNTTVTVYDDEYADPKPSYTIKYNVPPDTPVLYAVRIVNAVTLPGNAVTLIKNAIVAACAGQNGGKKVRIAQKMLASDVYPAIVAAVPTVQLLSVLLGPSTATLDNWTPGVDQRPVVSPANITVTLV